ncbi:E3 ubiquitin-protein ligase RBBP6-like isoform X2 [Olea europaea var. sylvestris]|uniref:E3 ubiquitin-protein ligase RBBP6-like isoform X2 n=1 Tax=Olea europaea var. sylvestris TaxID=158386 RepID=UPI000C1D628A|nr:E3 ubiquitin-protein ligase RBBP6-like isoform X2 [Olea europaea var. sylvestris]
MSIRFKFRSSVNFDTVDIDGRDSISVRKLRSKILSGKILGASRHDLDLVFLDADSDYKDDDIQIPSGSSVIVKRVPAGTVPSVMVPIETVEVLGKKDYCQMNPAASFSSWILLSLVPFSSEIKILLTRKQGHASGVIVSVSDTRT